MRGLQGELIARNESMVILIVEEQRGEIKVLTGNLSYKILSNI